MKNFILSVIIFAVVVFVIEMLHYAYKTMRNPDSRKIRKRLKTFSYKENNNELDELSDILQKKVLSDVPLLNKILFGIPGRKYLDRLLQQANAQHPLGVFILLTIFLAITGYLGSYLITNNKILVVTITLLLAGIPFFYLCMKKKNRIEKFQRQLPEGLDLIARSLKAGHAFPSSLKMAADEFDDPLGPEFHETLNEINFGVNVADALKNLTARVNCPDLKFFVISVILQRETGGNLAEIIENLSYIIRERFKLYGKIKTLAAEGKISAIILSSLPFFIMIALHFTSPTYISVLFSDPAGKIIIGIAAFMMVMGILVMKKLVNIKV